MRLRNDFLGEFCEFDSRECWAEIDGFPNYLVSNFGRVMNRNTGRVLKQQLFGRGYLEGNGHLYVSLYNEFGQKHKRVNRLVAAAFIGYLPDDLVVNHIDGNKINNHVENLEIATYSENNLHTYATGARQPVNPTKQVRCVETGEIFDSVNDAAQKFGVFATNISAAMHGRQKRVKGYTFELVN